MYDKLYVRRKSIVTVALSQDNRKIVIRYFVNQAPGFVVTMSSSTTESDTTIGDTFCLL